MNIKTLIKVEFSNLENRDPLTFSVIGRFSDDEKQTAHSKIDNIISSMPPEKMYLGWDNEVYPQYIIKESEVS